MPLRFEWDTSKAKSNLAKHGVSFEEASTVFGDPWSLTIPDPAYSQVEAPRDFAGAIAPAEIAGCRAYGTGRQHPHYSARPASRHERKTYEETH